jgi:uncharacterized protein YoxC
MEQYKPLIEMALWVIVATIGWFLRELWGAVKELQKDIHQIEVDMPSNYVKRDDFSDEMTKLRQDIRQDFQIAFKKIDEVRDRIHSP